MKTIIGKILKKIIHFHQNIDHFNIGLVLYVRSPSLNMKKECYKTSLHNI